MLAEIGLVATALSFVTAWFAIGASIYGERRNLEGWVISGRNAALFTALTDLVSLYGEDAVKKLAGGLERRIDMGEFTLDRNVQ